MVTGASSGIGRELAKQFAAHGFDLVINAEDARDRRCRSRAQGDRCRRPPGAGRPANLGGGRDAVLRRHRDRAAGEAAALNAGVGRGGAFLDTDLDDEIEIIDLNITSTVRLAKRLLRDMAARDEGRVLITSSIASTMPGSFQAVYNASKSFLQSFAEALQNELKDTGVTITSLMPGPTETELLPPRRHGRHEGRDAPRRTTPRRSPSRASRR